MRYYPKIVLSVPFTPVVGNRIFCDDNGSGSVALAEFKKFIDKGDFSSIHALYVSNDQREIFKENGFIERFDCNFKWKNDQYDTFDDYLGKLKSRYRKNIQKERPRDEIQRQAQTQKSKDSPRDKNAEKGPEAKIQRQAQRQKSTEKPKGKNPEKSPKTKFQRKAQRQKSRGRPRDKNQERDPETTIHRQAQ